MKVYWIKCKEHTDIMSEGYVGIASMDGLRGRVSTHFSKLRANSHPNPHLQNAYNKYQSLEVEIVHEGSEAECIAEEIRLRPQKEIGWNILEGGGLPPSHKGKHWFTDGKRSLFAEVCPTGYRPGRHNIPQGSVHGHYGKQKNYKTVQVKQFEKGDAPWNKGIPGDKKELVTCPHCNKMGGRPAMTRWHLDNCKERTQ